MVASSPLTSLIAVKPAAKGGGPAIYADGDVPSGQTMPYLTIGAWTQVPFHRLSPDADGYGWNCTVQIKAVGQRSENQLFSVLNEVFAIFPHGEALDVAGYSTAWLDEFNVFATIKTTLAGVTTYEVPAILRVYVNS